MGKLLDLYEGQQKTAEQEQEKQAQLELLSKYAELATKELEKTGQEFTSDDVVKVASFMIETDLAIEEEQAKVAEFVEAGQILARAFVAELQKQAESKKE